MHCSQCNACVRRCDHHCKWLGGTCVGVRNYKSFLFFTLYLTLYLLVTFISSVAYLWQLAHRQMLEQGESEMRVNHIMNSMKHSPLIWILLLANLCALALSGLLSGYHLLYVLPTNTTTQTLLKQELST